MVSIMSHKSSKMMGLLGLALAFILIWGEVRFTEAGCQRFGHSCFGAHGKRAEGGSGPEEMYPLPPQEQGPNYYPPIPIQQNRISPYLIDWLMAGRRSGQPSYNNYARDDLATGERRRK